MFNGLETNYCQSEKNLSGSWSMMTQTFNFLACGKLKTVIFIQLWYGPIIWRVENNETWTFINVFMLQGHWARYFQDCLMWQKSHCIEGYKNDSFASLKTSYYRNTKSMESIYIFIGVIMKIH